MNGNDTLDRWIRRFRTTPGAAHRLVCLPHAGGSASFFHPAAQALAPEVDVLAIQYPGRQDRRGESPATRIEDLAGPVAAALRADRDGRPFTLFGHSMGALVGYEIATRLEAAGIVPAALIVSGRRAPTWTGPEDLPSGTDAELVSHLLSLSGTAPSLLADQELVDMIMPAVRADYQAIRDYRFTSRPPLTTPVVVFAGDRDDRALPEQTAGWAALTTGGFEVLTFPGGHFYLSDHPHMVIDALRGQLLGWPSASSAPRHPSGGVDTALTSCPADFPNLKPAG